MLVEPGKAAFDHLEWTYKPKWDGIRILAYVQGESGSPAVPESPGFHRTFLTESLRR